MSYLVSTGRCVRYSQKIIQIIVKTILAVTSLSNYVIVTTILQLHRLIIAKFNFIPFSLIVHFSEFSAEDFPQHKRSYQQISLSGK